jgi:hypothetical protein
MPVPQLQSPSKIVSFSIARRSAIDRGSAAFIVTKGSPAGRSTNRRPSLQYPFI